MPTSERRRHVRHPIRLPIAVRPREGDADLRSHVGDLAEGGLCFDSPLPLAPGALLEVSLPVSDRRFTLTGTVSRCTPHEEGVFVVGVAFRDPETSFRLKLAEQVLRIEELRRDLIRERGAEVSEEEAARRWVDHYAREFAELYSA
jgi:hypothetical protein